MSIVEVLSAEQAAGLIPDRAVVAISSSSGLNTPDRVLRAIGERFAAEGRPRDLTTLHPIGTGDMYGIKGIDHLARPGLLKRVIAGSFPSGPSSLPSPEIWRMIGADAVEAYNLPSGLIFDMLRDSAAKRAGVLTQSGLDTFVDPRREGGKMNRAAKADIVKLVELDGQEWLHLPNIPPDVAIIRGTTADARGNIAMEHEAAPLGVIDLALAARNNGGLVIAQVKRLVEAGAIPTREVHVPCSLVDVVVVDPEQMQATETPYDPALSGELRIDVATLDGVPFGPEKIMARRAAMELADGDVAALGFGVSALVPRILIEEGAARCGHLDHRAGPGRRGAGDRALPSAARSMPMRSWPRRSSSPSFRAAASIAPSCRSCRSIAMAMSMSRSWPGGPTSPPGSAASSTSPPMAAGWCSAAPSPPAASSWRSRTGACGS